MMWAVRNGDGWRLATWPHEHEGVRHGRAVLAHWTPEALAGIGLHPVTEATPPAGQQGVGPWSLRDVDSAPVWAPAAWEDVPPEPMPVLSALQFWGMVLTLDAAGLDLSRRLNEAGAGNPVVKLALAHATAFEWPRFVALAASKATEAELAALAAAWRAASESET